MNRVVRAHQSQIARQAKAERGVHGACSSDALQHVAMRPGSLQDPQEVRIEQTVQMHDEIAHLSVVDRRLRLRLPGRKGARVIGKDAHDVERREILELDPVNARQLPAEDEMQELFPRSAFCRFLRHGSTLAYARFRIGPVFRSGDGASTPMPGLIRLFASRSIGASGRS